MRRADPARIEGAHDMLDSPETSAGGVSQKASLNRKFRARISTATPQRFVAGIQAKYNGVDLTTRREPP
jgi:hypothetical protein